VNRGDQTTPGTVVVAKGSVVRLVLEVGARVEIEPRTVGELTVISSRPGASSALGLRRARLTELTGGLSNVAVVGMAPAPDQETKDVIP
jgi:hypothetical protein